VEGEVAAYFGTSDIQFALRVGGGRVFGDQFPYFDASYLGGATDRGYRDHRFGGDASLYGNAELRMYLTKSKYQSVFPVRFGVIGFVDDGRVWLSGEDSNAWHPSAGGGILLKAVGTPIVIRAVVARRPEETLFYFGSGFRF
jgi:hemolysin activation/secretion protein